MKINFVLPFTCLTGGIKVAFEYCNRLTELGHDIIIYVPIKAYKFNNSGLLGSVKRIKSTIGNIVKRGTKVKWFNLKCKVKLVPIINNRYIRNADITVATAWPTAYDVYNLEDNKGEKVYLIQHYEIWSGNKTDVDNSYKLDINQVVIANWLKVLMKETFNKESKLIYNGIDKEEFIYEDKANNKNLVFCMLYHKLEWKGFSDGLKAFEIAKNKYPNIKLKIFGMEYGDNIPEYAEFYKNPSRKLLKKIYSSSDVYIFPSREEGWGLTVIEAMACKCAVVGTNTGALEEIGENYINSIISDTSDINSLAEHLIEVIENRDLLNKISNNGYKLALKFNWDDSVKKLEEFFYSLL